MAHSISAAGALNTLILSGCVDPVRVGTASVGFRDLSSRSTTLGLVVDGELTSVLKHLDDHASLRESDLYGHLARRSQLSEVIPDHRLLAADLLLVDAPPGSQDLDRHRAAHGLPGWAAGALGAAMASMHNVDLSEPTLIPDAPLPWILNMGNYGAAEWWSMSGAGRQLSQGLAELSDAPERVRELGASWRRTHLAHCDMKFGNIIIEKNRAVDRKDPKARLAKARSGRVWLIDWEIAGAGDPAWDLGCVVGQILAAWVASMGVRREVELADIVSDASFDLAEADSWLAQWWTSYVARRHEPIDHDTIEVTCAYAGVRVLQSGFEYGQHANRANGLVMTLAQLGANTVSNPVASVTSILPEFADALRSD